MAAPSTKVTTTTLAGALAYIIAEAAQRAGLLATVEPVMVEALQVVIAAVIALAAGYVVPETRPSPSAVALVSKRNGWRDSAGDPQYAAQLDTTPVFRSLDVEPIEIEGHDTLDEADFSEVKFGGPIIEPTQPIIWGSWSRIVRTTREEFTGPEPKTGNDD